MNNKIGRAYLIGDWKWYISHPLGFIKDLYGDIRAFYQRGTRGWADCDTWGLNYYLSCWLPQALKRLRDNSRGCPPELFDVTDITHEDNCHKWKDILDEMIDGFEAYRKFEDSYITDIKKEKEVNEKVRKSCELLGRWFGSLWD